MPHFRPLAGPDEIRTIDCYVRLVAKLQEFKEASRGMILGRIRPIESILAVGAIYREYSAELEPGCTAKIAPQDLSRIEDAMSICFTKGIRVVDDFRLTTMDLNGAGEGDFLKAEGQADLIVICNILNGTVIGLLSEGVFADDDGARKSEEHHIWGIWHRAAERFGARIIITYGYSSHEVGPQAFNPPFGQKNLYKVYAMERSCNMGDEGGMQQRGILVRNDLESLLNPSP